ncbi:MAG: adenosine kinase [Fibrobacterales bacterium]
MSKTILGVGAALVDLLIQESDTYLESLGSPKGGMTLVDVDDVNGALKKTEIKPSVVPGGSACNTIVGIGKLGGAGRFVGKVCDDALGKLFIDGLKKAHVDAQLCFGTNPSGRVLSVVTPDAQRTMFSALSVAAEIAPEDITVEQFAGVKLVHFEGYLAFNEPVFRKALEMAKSIGALVSLDLASFEVVGAVKPLFEEVIEKYVDIIIANEDEAKAFTGLDEEPALEELSKLCAFSVVKLGKKGALIKKDGAVTCVEAQVVDAIDTTGAGDLWAAGFLYGVVEGWSMDKCGTLASATGAEVVQVLGAVIPESGWERIAAVKAQLEK